MLDSKFLRSIDAPLPTRDCHIVIISESGRLSEMPSPHFEVVSRFDVRWGTVRAYTVPPIDALHNRRLYSRALIGTSRSSGVSSATAITLNLLFTSRCRGASQSVRQIAGGFPWSSPAERFSKAAFLVEQGFPRWVSISVRLMP